MHSGKENDGLDIHTFSAYNGIVMPRHSSATAAHKRVNVTLPPETLHLIDRLSRKGNRSRFLDNAVKFYVTAIGRSALRKQLKAGAIQRAERDLRLAEEWFSIEDEAWHGTRK